jgi:hypothetical protein
VLARQFIRALDEIVALKRNRPSHADIHSHC